jgi:hypothetical protein
MSDKIRLSHLTGEREEWSVGVLECWSGVLGIIGDAGVPDLATKRHMVPVGIQHNEIPHPIRLVGGFHFHDGALFRYLLKVIIDLVAEDKSGTSSNRPFMNLMATQMKAGVPVADSSVSTKLEVLFKAENLFIIFERVSEIADLEDRTYP